MAAPAAVRAPTRIRACPSFMAFPPDPLRLSQTHRGGQQNPAAGFSLVSPPGDRVKYAERGKALFVALSLRGFPGMFRTTFWVCPLPALAVAASALAEDPKKKPTGKDKPAAKEKPQTKEKIRSSGQLVGELIAVEG